jgi:hypothetical protein
MATRATIFMIGGTGLPAVTFIRTEPGMVWRKDVLPCVGKLVCHLTRLPISWDHHFIWDVNWERDQDESEWQKIITEKKFPAYQLHKDGSFESVGKELNLSV